MADNYTNFFDVENTFSAWLDGTLSQEEEKSFMDFCASNSDMQEIMEANDQLDETYESIVEDGYELPQEILDDFVIPQIETNNEDFYSYEELTDINDTDIQEETNHLLSEDVPNEEDNENNEVTDTFGDFDLI
jgi:hypothetical protein